MTLRVVGLTAPSVLGEWGFAILRRMLETCFPQVRIYDVGHGADVPPFEGSGRDEVHLLLSSEPGPALVELLADPSIPTVAFLDDPVAAVAYALQADADVTQLDAIRTLSRTLSAVVTISRQRPILTVARSRATETDALRILSLLAQHLLEQTGNEVFRLFASRIERLGPEPVPLEVALARLVPAYRSVAESAARLTGPWVDIAEACLSGLNAAATGEPLRVRWPRAIFRSDDVPDELGPMVDLFGIPRILFFGPHMHLPEGRLRARATLGFSAGASRSSFLLSVQNPTLLAEARIFPPDVGLFTAELGFVVRECRQPHEFLVRIDRGAIEGRMTIVGVEFVDDAPHRLS